MEIQIDARNFVRVGSSAMLRVMTLRDEGVALSVIEGTASVRLAKFDREKEYFEVDAPQSTLAAEQKGVYRIDVARAGRVRFTVTDGGRARIYSETSGFALRDGRAAELINEGSDAGDWELLAAAPRDSWDNWVSDRERYLAERMRHDTQYYDQYVWGGEDLDSYGTWAYANDYGWMWRPHATVINNYHNWAPYRYGNWTWLSPYGWTWVGYEPWGWAPYHYGRWVYHNNYWAWCPRSYYYGHRSWWRPALVAFHFSFGNHVSWYPLSYHHRDPRSRRYNFLTPPGKQAIHDARRNNLAYRRGVTTATIGDFGGDNVRFKAANNALARKVVGDDPLKGDLLLRPANVVVRNENGANTRVTLAKPRVKPAADLVERPTGAAIRKPGVALDGELRNSRVFGGRETKFITRENPSGNTGDSQPSGAVTRLPGSGVKQLDDRNDLIRRGDQDTSRTGVTKIDPSDNTGVIKRPEIKAQPERKLDPNDSGSIETPSRLPKIDSDSSAKPDRVTRPQPRERVDTPTPRYEPPARKYEPPPQRSEPRSEPPQRSEPVRKYEPPPQRSQPRSEPQPSSPPPKSDPPTQKSDPVRVRPSKKEAP